MTFEELWLRVKAMNTLPHTAIVQIPSVLSDETKRKLSRTTPEEVAVIVKVAIREVNNGSVEPLDELIRERI